MPRYYFDVSDDTDTRDGEGLELASREQAEAEAVRVLAETLLDFPKPLPKIISVNVRLADGGAGFRIVLRCEAMG